MHPTVNTLRPRQNGCHFADDIFNCIFLKENIWIPIKISLKFVPTGSVNNITVMVHIMAWCWPGRQAIIWTNDDYFTDGYMHHSCLNELKYAGFTMFIVPLASTKLKSGILVSRRPFICPSLRPSVDKIVSTLYLLQYYSDPFHICTSYQATSEGVSCVKVIARFQFFWQFFLICNFDFVLLWHGIWYELIVWVIMGGRGVFSERRPAF